MRREEVERADRMQIHMENLMPYHASSYLTEYVHFAVPREIGAGLIIAQ